MALDEKSGDHQSDCKSSWRDINVSTTFHGNPSNNYWDILLDKFKPAGNRKSQGITKIIAIHHLGTVDIGTKDKKSWKVHL